MKLISCLAFISRGLERPGRMGVTNLAISESISGGIFTLSRNSRHICTATEKLTLYSYFLSFFLMTTCEVINSEKLYMINRARFPEVCIPPFLSENEVSLRYTSNL